MAELVPFRLLITGSRDWCNPRWIDRALADASALVPPGARLVVVHGRCDPRTYSGGQLITIPWDDAEWLTPAEQMALLGADWQADVLARKHGWGTEQHPADWEAPCTARCQPDHRKRRADGTIYCPAAGFYRNERMIATRPHLGAAFIRAASRGATHCYQCMTKAAIPARPYRAAA